jgi:aryl-alcohol dehydrogenase-like predicted oxidoreductase
MTWSEENNEYDGFKQMDYAFDRGVNFFDIMEVYSIPPKGEAY